MKIGELVAKKGASVETVKTGDNLKTAITKMNDKHVGSLMVLDDAGKIAGIVSERDFMQVCAQCGEGIFVNELMTPVSKLVTINPKDSLQDAMKKFTEKRIRHLPVIDNGNLVGILSIGDAVKSLLDAVAQENKYLNEYIMGQNI